MRKLLLALMTICFGGAAWADGEAAGDFDYYVMALSWSPNWCALEGDDRRDPQCDDGLGLTFTLHGLWPQYENGWPSYCRTGARDPSRRLSEGMADIMGGSGVAWHQWKKHGRCAGLAAEDYYGLMRRAYASVVIPEVFARISTNLKVPAVVVENAFLEANPGLQRDQVTITCAQGHIQEVRICLTTDLEPRHCGADVIRDCKMTDAVLDAVR